MFRVLLKIDRVSLRVKQVVDLHIKIKKKQQSFSHCKRCKLVNGTAAPQNTSEFFISMADPSFEIDIFLLVGQLKKRGGSVQLKLNNYAINTSHRITSIIQNTPLTNSTLLLDFVCLDSQQPTTNLSLYSVQQFEEARHKQSMKKFSEQNQALLFHNQLLTNTITGLKQKNGILVRQTAQMIEQSDRLQSQFKAQMNRMEEQKNQYSQAMLRQKKKIAQIVDMLNQTGEADLINEMGDIINKKQKDYG